MCAFALRRRWRAGRPATFCLMQLPSLQLLFHAQCVPRRGDNRRVVKKHEYRVMSHTLILEAKMDRETLATLHRRRVGRPDKTIKDGSLRELVRQFQSLSRTQQEEYFIMIGPTVCGLQRILELAAS
jgi:hypothetical protein